MAHRNANAAFRLSPDGVKSIGHPPGGLADIDGAGFIPSHVATGNDGFWVSGNWEGGDFEFGNTTEALMRFDPQGRFVSARAIDAQDWRESPFQVGAAGLGVHSAGLNDVWEYGADLSLVGSQPYATGFECCAPNGLATSGSSTFVNCD